MQVKCVHFFENKFDPIKEGNIYSIFVTKLGFAGLLLKEGPALYLTIYGKFTKGQACPNSNSSIKGDVLLMSISDFRRYLKLGNLEIVVPESIKI
jgi:hypothetical protein